MAFWGTPMDSNSRDPKRKFRFKVEIQQLGQADGLVWYAKTVQKPTVNISADTAHQFLGHTFKFPGSVTWDDIEITLVDPADTDEDAAKRLLSIIQGAGYAFPETAAMNKTISKGASVESLEKVVIYQLDGLGNTVERWSLHNPFINKVAFGDLSYEDDGLSEVTLGITFDWAEFEDPQGNRLYFDPPPLA